MANDPIGMALAALSKIAGSETVERLGLRKGAEAFAYRATRTGFAAASAAARQFEAATELLSPERLPRPERKSDRFDLTETDEQKMFRESVRRFADDSMRAQAVEAETACLAPDQLLAELGELGLAHLVVPEALGGMATERSPVTGVLVAEELGRGDMGLAIAALAPIGVANALVRWGSAAQQVKYLPAFLTDAPPRAAIAITEPQPLFEPAEMTSRATSDGDGFLLSGVKSLVPLGRTADFFLVAAELDTKGPHVFIVRRDSPGVSIEAAPAMGIRAADTATLTLTDVRLENADLLGERPGACDFTELVDLARIAWCALAVGTSQAVLDYVIPYCNDRIAFGEPVSHRQSVAFMIADLAIELEGMRLLTLRAASRAEAGESFHREAYLARVACAEHGMKIGTDGVQLLGGHGFIKEHPVERWYRDLRVVGSAEGALMV